MEVKKEEVKKKEIVIKEKGPMEKEEFKKCLTLINMKPNRLAIESGRTATVGFFWSQGRIKVPKDIRQWLRKMVKIREENPIPKKES